MTRTRPAPASSTRSSPSPAVRLAWQLHALFDVFVGLTLMGNPLLGPKLGVNGYLVALVGIGLQIAAIFLGGAGLGRGPLAGRVRALIAADVVCAAALVAWAVLADLGGGARGLLLVIAVGLLVLAFVAWRALKKPANPGRRAPTQAELQAALRGERR